MWKGHVSALELYMNHCIQEWIKRGYKNTMQFAKTQHSIVYPTWFGNDQFHSSHRSNLLRKYSEWYSQFGWKEDTSQPYFWPNINEEYK